MRRRAKALRQRWWTQIPAHIVVVVVLLVATAPMIWVMVSSFKTNNQVFTSAFSLPTSVRFGNYAYVFEITQFETFFFNSVVISAAAIVLGLTIYAPCAYVIARATFKGKFLLLIAIAATLLIPAHAMLQPIFSMVRGVGLYDTRLALVLVYAGGGVAVPIYVLRSGFKIIPRELEESAYMDGAGFVRTFIAIIVPLAKPSFVTVTVIRFLAHWNEFLYAFMLTSSTSNRTIPVSLRYFTLQFSYNFPAMFAAVTMAILPSIVIYAAFMETITGSMTAGSVKS